MPADVAWLDTSNPRFFILVTKISLNAPSDPPSSSAALVDDPTSSLNTQDLSVPLPLDQVQTFLFLRPFHGNPLVLRTAELESVSVFFPPWTTGVFQPVTFLVIDLYLFSVPFPFNAARSVGNELPQVPIAG